MILQGLRSRALIALEAELHVLRRQPVAVVKLQPRAELELPARGIGGLPLRGQPGVELSVGMADPLPNLRA